MINENTNGYIQRSKDGKLFGELKIDGVDMSPIVGVMFKNDGETFLWLRRKDMLIYDVDEQKYIARKREPRWEAYLEKKLDGNTVTFRGEFYFLRIRYSIVGVWDKVLGASDSRLNLFVDRLPMNEQDIILGIQQKLKSNGATK